MAYKHRFQYSVVGPAGELSERYPLEAKYPDPWAVVNYAAEDYHGRPESEGAAWPLTFVAFTTAGQEIGRFEVKCWLVPHFLITSRPLIGRDQVARAKC